MANVKNIAKDFIVAYVPYAIIAEILAFMFGIEWWKQLVIVGVMIAFNMAFNVLILILSTYRYKVINDWMKSRKK